MFKYLQGLHKFLSSIGRAFRVEGTCGIIRASVIWTKRSGSIIKRWQFKLWTDCLSGCWPVQPCECPLVMASPFDRCCPRSRTAAAAELGGFTGWYWPYHIFRKLNMPSTVFSLPSCELTPLTAIRQFFKIRNMVKPRDMPRSLAPTGIAVHAETLDIKLTRQKEQESRATAKMTARCALYLGTLKIFESPWVGPRLLFPKFLMDFSSEGACACAYKMWSS